MEKEMTKEMVLDKEIGKIQTTSGTSDTSMRNAAIVAGSSLLIMAIVAGFAVGFVFDSLIVPGDAAATANNVQASESLFRAGIFSWLVILILDVLVAWGLYVFLRPVNKHLSLLSGWLRLAYTAVLGVALLNLVFVLLLSSGADYLKAFESAQLQALVLLFLNAFDGIWSIGLVIFGLHLLVLGYLVLKSGYIPKILGILLVIAAFGYLITDGANLLLPNNEAFISTLEMIFMLPMIVGEVGLALWLLFKGQKVQPADYRALETAQ